MADPTPIGMAKNSAMAVVASVPVMIASAPNEFVDWLQDVYKRQEIAPEHLELCCEDPRAMIPLLANAGAVFLGPYTPASLGDYIAGPSHTLPTFGSARYASVLGVEDFLRRVHVISADRQALSLAAPHVAAIARAEGLAAHASSVMLRCEPQPIS